MRNFKAAVDTVDDIDGMKFSTFIHYYEKQNKCKVSDLVRSLWPIESRPNSDFVRSYNQEMEAHYELYYSDEVEQ